MIINYPFVKPKQYRITQLFGARFVYSGKTVKHKGVDFAVPKGTFLLSLFNGVIVRVEKTRDFGYGKSVYIKTNDKTGVYVALLAHCSRISVDVGQRVKIGQNVATSGNSGFWRGKTGYHVHLGLKKNGCYVNPLPYFGITGQTSFFSKKEKEKKKDSLKYHIVKKGESLWKIAQKHYGSGSYYNEIFAANLGMLETPRIIQPGQRLLIPELDDRGI